MNTIAVFNNKGGVGKTTLVCNLASYLAKEKQQKVLVIDADPQCNTSIYMMPEESIMDYYSLNDPPTIERIMYCKQSKGSLDNMTDLPIVPSQSFGVDVILGDTIFAGDEDFFSRHWQPFISGDVQASNSTLVFRELLKILSDRGYDYVFFDVGPSLGALNRAILMSSDYFIMPMTNDVFCVRAIDNISRVLKKWIDEFKIGIEKHNERARCEEDKVIVNNPIRFLGYSILQYKTKTTNGIAEPIKAYEEIMSKMPDNILEKFGFLYDKQIENQLLLGNIPTLSSLVPFSQSAHKPIFELNSADRVFGNHAKKVKEFKDTIGTICESMLTNMSRND